MKIKIILQKTMQLEFIKEEHYTWLRIVKGNTLLKESASAPGLLPIIQDLSVVSPTRVNNQLNFFYFLSGTYAKPLQILSIKSQGERKRNAYKNRRSQ
ncbi:unnamed protein product [Paramecium octaurelia]|uniref:Uncharacterized protein n=1 Tax=Paramecium octaurelia TaxID=43137 RepID=A0A8S1WE17_PAROT|nr:unnamed protein product [Paramecium octaurelia]